MSDKKVQSGSKATDTATGTATTVTVQKKKGAVAGVPRVTDAILALTEADKQKWIAEKRTGMNAVQIAAFEKALKNAPNRKPKSVNWDSFLAARPYDEVLKVAEIASKLATTKKAEYIKSAKAALETEKARLAALENA